MSPTVLLLALALAPAVSAQESALSRGQKLSEEGKYVEALDALLDGLKDSPESLELHSEIAKIGYAMAVEENRLRMSEPERRQAVAEAAAALAEERERTLGLDGELERVRRQLDAGDGPRLLEASSRLTRLDQRKIEDDVLKRRMADYIALLQDKLRAAVSSGRFSRPQDQLAARGFLWYYQGRYAETLKNWRQALAIDPSDTALREQTLWVEKAQRQRQRRETIDRLLALTDELYRQGRLEEASAQVRTLALIEGKDPALEKSVKDLEQKISRADLASRLARARRAAATEPLRSAQAWLAVLEVDPANAEAKASLQTIQSRLMVLASRENAPPRRPAPAPKAALAPKTPRRAEAEQEYALGLIYYAQNDLAKARSSMETALSLDPDLQGAKTSLERIRSELGAP